MAYLLIACLTILVFGLNLKVISRTLDVTDEIPKDVIIQLRNMGLKITIAGIAILIIGLIAVIGITTWGLEPRLQEGFAITSMGFAVIALGFTTIIRAVGHRHKEAVRKGARNAIWIGAVLFAVSLVAYFIMAYLPKG